MASHLSSLINILSEDQEGTYLRKVGGVKKNSILRKAFLFPFSMSISLNPSSGFPGKKIYHPRGICTPINDHISVFWGTFERAVKKQQRAEDSFFLRHGQNLIWACILHQLPVDRSGLSCVQNKNTVSTLTGLPCEYNKGVSWYRWRVAYLAHRSSCQIKVCWYYYL